MALISSIPLTSTFIDANTVQKPDGTSSSGFNGSVAVPGKMYISDQGGNIGRCMTCTISDTDTPLFGGIRAEVTMTADNNATEYWYKWEQYLPVDFGTLGTMTTMQIHDTPDGGDPAKFPNFLFATDGSDVIAYVPLSAPTEQLGGRAIGRLPLIKGRWTTVCLHVRWENASSIKSFMEVIYDGVSMCKEFLTINHYVDTVGPYLKVGLYDAFDTPSFGTRTAHFRNAEKYDSASNYENVLGALPVSKKIYN